MPDPKPPKEGERGTFYDVSISLYDVSLTSIDVDLLHKLCSMLCIWIYKTQNGFTYL